jgi:hypothetical protein
MLDMAAPRLSAARGSTTLLLVGAVV